MVREKRWPPIESHGGHFSQLSFNSKVAFSSDSNIRNDIWSDSFWGVIVEVVKEAEMLADGTMANVRAALSGKAAITRPAKRAIWGLCTYIYSRRGSPLYEPGGQRGAS